MILSGACKLRVVETLVAPAQDKLIINIRNAK